MPKTLVLFLFFGFFIQCLAAQQTGSFNLDVNFNETDYNFDRTLYYYVPTDYDATQAYPLFVGFRGGPHSNAGQFRDQLTFLADSLGAIILCPENIDHFNTNEGLTKQLFKYSVEMTQEMYSIDPDFIYLTGLSFGGRHAVIVSMDTDNGEIPQLRGVIPFATGANGHLEPDYESIEEFAPACVCIGLSDSQTFISVANNLTNDINSNGGDVFLNEIPNVGHTVVFPTYKEEMMECFNYIESTYEISSVEEIIQVRQTMVYPNPSSQTITFEIDNDYTPSRIYLSNLNGVVIKEIPKKDRSVSVADLQVGIYFLAVESNDGMESIQVIVE